MITVYISHPANSREELSQARMLINSLQRRPDILVLCPYLLHAEVRFIQRLKELSRPTDIEHHFDWHDNFGPNIQRELWIYGDRVSPRMVEEMRLALKRGIPIVSHTPETYDGMDQFVTGGMQNVL